MRSELRAGERLELVVHKHWVTVLQPLAWTVLPLALAPVAWYAGFDLAGLLIAALALVPGAWLAIALLDRSSNIWAVTNQRVIDEFGILSRNSKESPLDKINNVSFQQGLWGRMLGYGNVQIQTAAELGETTYEHVTNPRRLKDTIARAQEGAKQAQTAAQARVLAAAVAPGAAADGETKECPYCAETIKARAKLCRFCGKQLPA